LPGPGVGEGVGEGVGVTGVGEGVGVIGVGEGVGVTGVGEGVGVTGVGEGVGVTGVGEGVGVGVTGVGEGVGVTGVGEGVGVGVTGVGVGVGVGVGGAAWMQKVPSITGLGAISFISPADPSFIFTTSISSGLHSPGLPSACNVTVANVTVPGSSPGSGGPGELHVAASMRMVETQISRFAGSVEIKGRSPADTLVTFTTEQLTVSVMVAPPMPNSSSVLIVMSTSTVPPSSSVALPILTEVPGSASTAGVAAITSENTSTKLIRNLLQITIVIPPLIVSFKYILVYGMYFPPGNSVMVP
jgi:hypothetical protein